MKHKIDLDMNENEDIINLEERSRIAEQNNISQNNVNNRNSHIESEISLENSQENLSDTTETEVISALVEQAEYYASSEKEETKSDTEKTLQTYIKKIFRQVKFLTDSGKDFKEPNFVDHIHGQKTQAAELCEYLWKCLGKVFLLNNFIIDEINSDINDAVF